MKKITYILYSCGVSLILIGCGAHSHDHNKEEEQENHNDNHVHFHKEMQDSSYFKAEPVIERQMGTIIRTVARIMPSPSDETIITAKTDGIVSLPKQTISEGSEISAGKVICSINGSVSANNNLGVRTKQTEAEYKRAKAEYDRMTALRKDNLVLESELKAAMASYENAKAEYEAIKSSFSNGSQTIISPRSGYIKQILIQNGEHVTEGQAIAVITDNHKLRLKADVQASYSSILKDIYDANIRQIDNGNTDNKTWSFQELEGKLISYGKQTSESSALIPITFEINNVGNFVPGTYIEMFIKTRSANRVTCVPSSAVLEDMGMFFVYVQINDETFEKRQVTIGTTDGIHTHVTSGVKKGEKIVSKGATLVKLQQASGSVDAHAGHSH